MRPTQLKTLNLRDTAESDAPTKNQPGFMLLLGICNLIFRFLQQKLYSVSGNIVTFQSCQHITELSNSFKIFFSPTPSLWSFLEPLGNVCSFPLHIVQLHPYSAPLICYFSYCCRKILDAENFKEERFNMAHSFRENMAEQLFTSDRQEEAERAGVSSVSQTETQPQSHTALSSLRSSLLSFKHPSTHKTRIYGFDAQKNFGTSYYEAELVFYYIQKGD